MTPSWKEWWWWEGEVEDGGGDPKKKSAMKLSKRERGYHANGNNKRKLKV